LEEGKRGDTWHEHQPPSLDNCFQAESNIKTFELTENRMNLLQNNITQLNNELLRLY